MSFTDAYLICIGRTVIVISNMGLADPLNERKVVAAATAFNNAVNWHYAFSLRLPHVYFINLL